MVISSAGSGVVELQVVRDMEKQKGNTRTRPCGMVVVQMRSVIENKDCACLCMWLLEKMCSTADGHYSEEAVESKSLLFLY